MPALDPPRFLLLRQGAPRCCALLLGLGLAGCPSGGIAPPVPDLAAGADLSSGVGDGGTADLSTPADLLASPDLTPPGCAAVTGAGQSVLPECATEATLRDDGNGFRPPPPAGSTCHGEESYTLQIPSGVLRWSRCMIPGDFTTPWTLQTGTRTLQAAELASALASLRGVLVTQGMMGCGADKPLLTLTLTLPSGTQTYTDSFYACNGGPTIYVDHIDDAFSTVGALAR